MAVTGRRHVVGIGRRCRRRRDTRIGRELSAATAAAGRRRSAYATAIAAADADAHVLVFAGRRERVVDVRHESRQGTAGHRTFRRGGRSVRERTRRQAFCEFRAFHFDVRR